MLVPFANFTVHRECQKRVFVASLTICDGRSPVLPKSWKPFGGIKMSKHHDADLILKLYELRREPVMREARNWWWTFNPTSMQDVIDTLLGEHSGHYRMVLSYWEMAAAMVNSGAIDEQLFNESNGEQIFVYSKIEPVLEDLRKMFDSPDFLSNLEAIVKRIPDSEKKIANMRARMKKFAEMREARTAQAQAAAGA